MKSIQNHLIFYATYDPYPHGIIRNIQDMKCNLLYSVSLIFASLATATNYYVSETGSNSNDGRSPAKGTGTSGPFLTVANAAGLSNPGDTIFCMNGTYDGFTISRSGSPSAWIVYTALQDHVPRIHGTSWQAIDIRANYIEIHGFEIYGDNSSLTLSQCDVGGSKYGSGECNCAGIALDGRNGNHPHHIRIISNKIHDLPGGGIQTIQADYITMENNIVYNNAWFTQYAMSGISTWQNWRFDDSTGYKMIITRNKVYGNETRVKWSATNALSDGNGIIIDDTKNTQNGSTLGRYTGRTLVANNICFNNGGSGIHSYESEHVDIVNNTSYNNGLVVGYACIFAGSSNDVRILNNIMYAAPGKKVNSTSGNTEVIYDYNIYYGGLAPSVTGPHDRVTDPQFVNLSTNPLQSDFHLKSTSPAIGQATPFTAVTTDFTGISRPQGSAPDIGAYEYVNPVRSHAFIGYRHLRPAPKPAHSMNLTGYRPVSHGVSLNGRFNVSVDRQAGAVLLNGWK
jgi:hypothetical protein